MSDIRLENKNVLLVIDVSTGAIREFVHKPTGWRCQDRQAHARAFTMNVPLPDRLLNPVSGVPEGTTVSAGRDGVSARIVWDGVRGPHSETMDIRLTVDVSLTAEGLLFTAEVVNRSEHVVESIAYPCLGDISVPEGASAMRNMYPMYAGMEHHSLYPEFTNQRGYWGTDFPYQAAASPLSPFCLVQADSCGLYIGCHDTSMTERVQYRFDLTPGYGKMGRLPDGGRIGDQDACLTLSVEHFLFSAPGQSAALAPIALSPYSGTWHAGADLYANWRGTWMTNPAVPDWLSDPHSWQQVQMTSWGDSLRISYQDLKTYIDDCVENGVTAIQLVGWTIYGQDGRLPHHDTDPRLGSRDELRDAIRYGREKGIHIVLYEKYTCTDVSTDWYKDELHAYASKDVFGNTHGHGGWMYHTPAHLAGINTRPYAWMCMNSEKWREISLEQIRQSLDLEPDGILLDESATHGRYGYFCFDPDHGHNVPAHNFEGDTPFERDVVKLLESTGETMVFAGEGNYELQQRHYNLSYHRARRNHIALSRYLDAFYPMMSWVVGYDDREGVNLCLLYRYIISYEPQHFKGRLGDFPLTLEYGKKVDSLRVRYRKYLWDAECRDTVGAQVTLVAARTEFEAADSWAYAVYAQPESGRRAVVIVNHAEAQTLEVSVELGRDRTRRSGATSSGTVAAGTLSVVSPEHPDPHEIGDAVSVPPRSASVVLEDYSS